MDFQITCNKTVELVKSTAEFIRQERKIFSSDKIEKKGEHDFVSYVDKGAEKLLVDGLEQILPEAGFIAEEGTSTRKGDIYNWIIDPLDGTTNFIHGITPYSISVALMKDQEIVIGVVLEVGLNECFYAWKNGGAFLNGKEIEVSKNANITDSLIATGFPYYDYDRIKPFLASLEHFMRESHGVRRLGSAATDLVYVACGRFESFYEYSLNPWDVAAGALIVQEAGGKVCDFEGNNNYIFGREIIASNSNVHREFLNTVNTYLVKKEF